MFRPFLHPLWAALYSPEAGSPKGTIWTKQVKPTLLWLRAYFQGSAGGIERRFDLCAYQRRGIKIEIGTDASPFGLGGWIALGESIKHHFFCPVTADDERIFQIKSGTSVGQQIWECLAILVALRIWLPVWSQHRLNLSVKGDNIGALTLLLKMRPHSARHAIIARELALILIEAPFFPEVHHTPGVAHVVADELSRAYMPGRSGDDTVFTHPALAASMRTDCPPRDSSWYRGNLGQTSFA